jgi:hypothetical protein
MFSRLAFNICVPGVTLGGDGETEVERKGSGIDVAITSSFGLHTGTKFVLISTAVCNIGFYSYLENRAQTFTS